MKWKGLAVAALAVSAVAWPAAAASRPFITEAPAVESAKYAGRQGASVKLEARLADGAAVPIRVEVLASHIVRIRAERDGSFAPTLPENDGFLKSDWTAVAIQVDDSANQTEIIAPGVRVVVTKSPFKIAFLQDGKLLTESAGLNQGTDDAMLSMVSPGGEQFYGFSDQGSGEAGRPVRPDRAPFLHRGTVLTMASLTCHRIYHSPFFMSSRGYGFFLNTLVRSDWDMARLNDDRYTIHWQDPRLDFYFIAGPKFSDILYRYTELTGRPPLPPKWHMGKRVSAPLLGNHKPELYGERLRYNNPETWFNQKQIESVAKKTREQKLPVDIYHLDAGWETDHNSFDWVPEITDPAGMLDLLHSLNFHIRIWQRPTLATNPYPFFKEGVEKGYFVKTPDGKPFVCDYHFRGPSVMVDFTNPDAVEWWKEKCRWLVDLGADTFKLDSGSSGFYVPYPEAADMRFHNGLTGKEMDNYYGPLYVKTVWDTLKESLNGRRAVLQVMHAMYFAGGKYPYPGLGDRGHAGLPMRIRTALNYGLSGVPFYHGGDTGAFGCPPLDDQYGNGLTPYTYTLWREAHETGMPVLRAMMLENDDDPVAATIEDQYYFGDSFLVATVFELDASWREMYVPEGEWIEFGGHRRHLGPARLNLPVRNGRDPALVKEGAIIPIGPRMEYTGQKPNDKLTLEIYPGGKSSFTLYEDDDETYAYESGAFTRTTFECEERADGIAVSIAPVKGNFDGAPVRRTYRLDLRSVESPSDVRVGGRTLSRVESLDELEGPGWFYRVQDRRLVMQLSEISTAAGAEVVLDSAKPLRFYTY